MANPADIPAIHSIINSVNRHAPIASPDVPPEQLARDRGTFLATMAHSILNIIRDGIDAEGKRKYEAVYAILEAASHGDPEQYLQAGEALWAFTLQAFQLATHRRVTGHGRDQRGASAHPPPDPRAYARGQARNAGGSAYALGHGGAHQMGVPVGTTAGSPSTNVIVLHSPCCHTPHLQASPVPPPRALSPLPPPPPPGYPSTSTGHPAYPPAGSPPPGAMTESPANAAYPMPPAEDLPSYEEMIVEALMDTSDPEGARAERPVCVDGVAVPAADKLPPECEPGAAESLQAWQA
ncbi:hypothetical protein EVJ58_g2004 [Rhodofomes roseus]|uniref:Uncharacterized protein n=1 Tax=Rhodofomes roseus TaxID=34475 RepID=A0A4Y9YSJ2_9APHY|nr:hypothetical protein EVJ58_g2004 [Rhodofomes roseus]